jgi:hypothetical protein
LGPLVPVREKEKLSTTAGNTYPSAKTTYIFVPFSITRWKEKLSARAK